MSKIFNELKKGAVNKLTEEGKSKQFNQVMKQINKDIENNKDRLLFICPDIDVVNPLVKTFYDIVRVLNESGVNAYIVHEHEGFKVNWLKGYGKVKVDYLHKKVSKKGTRLKKEYEFKISDSLFVPDTHLELLIDLPSNPQFQLIQKTVIATGYAGLYTMVPGKTFNSIGVHNIIFFEEQVRKDYEKIYFGYKSFSLKEHYTNNFSIEKKEQEEPYILVSGVGNIEMINEFANIFYNKYPLFDFIKIKVVNRSSLESFADEVKNAILFVDIDRKYITNFNANMATQFNTPYMSLNGQRERLEDYSVNLIEVKTDMFGLVEDVVKYVYQWLNNKSSNIYNSVYKVKRETNNELFKNEVLNVVRALRLDKKEYFEKIINA